MAGEHLARVIQRLRRTVADTAEGPSDRDLLRRYAAARDEEAFASLVERHGAMVRGVCRRVLNREADAEDAFQATFLLLARKAGSTFWQASITGWLYQVAYRTACKARVDAARRQRHEQATEPRSESVAVSPELQELQRTLDEELSRMPERFRLPVLLCCLHDQTTDEAARQLGWSFTTVKGRLQRGREMLRRRLQKRGIGLGIAAVGTLLPAGAARALPASVVTSTIQAVVHGGASPAAMLLSQGVARAMLWTKIKMALVFVMAGTVIAVGAIAASRHGGAGPAAVAAPIPTEVKPRKEQTASEPVVKDGLEVVVTPTRAVFEAGQAPTVNITYTNRSDKTFALYIDFAAVQFYRYVDAKSGDTWQAGPWLYERTAAPEIVILAPGKSIVRTEPVMGGCRLLNAKQPIESRRALPAGTYGLTAHVVFQQPRALKAAPACPFWSGEITSKPVDVTLAK